MAKNTTPSTTPDDDLRERLAQDPPIPIKLADGDLVIGDFLGYDRKTSFDYGDFFVAVMENPDVSGVEFPPELATDATINVALFHEALKNQFKRLRPKKGDRLAIKRIGKVKSQNSGRVFTNYSVASANEDASAVTEADVFGEDDLDAEPEL